MKEIAQKYRAIYKKYGAGAIYNTYGTSASYGGTFSNPSAARSALTSVGSTRSAFSDYSYHQYNYANTLTGHPDVGGPYNNYNNIGANFHAMAGGAIKNLVSWGSNVLSTNNSVSYGYIRAVEYLKKRGGKAIFIGPEFTDTGVTCHTEWVKLRNYTDAALILAMMYHMITNTFEANGNLKPNPMLDINYIDTCVYGFFASPKYWVDSAPYTDGKATHIGKTNNQNAGTIAVGTEPEFAKGWTRKTDTTYYVDSRNGNVTTTKPSKEEEKHFYSVSEVWVKGSRYSFVQPYRIAEEVPAGRSLADYIMGSDTRLSKVDYVTAQNYTAQKFKGTTRGSSTGCTYEVTKGTDKQNGTEYQYKRDFNTPKTPEWASKITGVPVEKIKELAELYANPESNILTEWCGGFQKQENGVMNVFALSALLCITKTFGKWGGGMYGPWASNILNDKGEFNVGTTNDIEFLNMDNISAGKSGTTVNISQPTAPVSCTQWFNGIKLAFHDVLKNKGYSGSHIPNWNIDDTRYSNDDAGTKAGVVWERDTNGKILTYTDDTDHLEYYKYKGQDTSTPEFAGTRMIISSGGGIPVNQHSNVNDTAEMYKVLPISGNPDNADTFCLVTFDVYLSPTARYADYVIPSTIALEAADTMWVGEEPIYRPAVVRPQGDAKTGWEWAYLAHKAQSELGPFEGAIVNPKAHLDYVKSKDGKYRDIEDIANEVVEEAIKNPASRFYGMSKAQVYANQFVPKANTEEVMTSEPIKPDNSGKMRTNLNNYLKDKDILKNRPFIFTKENNVINSFNASIASKWACSDDNTAGGIKGRTDGKDRPDFVGRMQVYNPTAVWDYEHLNSKYHGWLPAEQRGQSNKDFEEDAIVYPIPMYIAFEDCFKEAYDGFAGGKHEAFFKGTGKDKPLTMSTTHDRFRVHSTHNENPLMRELNHRTVGGGWASGNDWKEYVVQPTQEPKVNGNAGITGMLSSAIQSRNKETASWHEIWMSTEDAKERGIRDGDLCLVENPIGSVRVIARVTDRCMKGHLNLHQGAWYDPNMLQERDSFGHIIDDGGCANSLISSKPSRYDRGNAQQFAYVKISKTEFYFKGE